MTAETLADKYRKLVALGTDPRTPEHEAAVANSTAAKMLELYPDLETVGTAEVAELDIAYRDRFDRLALVQTGRFLGLSVFPLEARYADGRVRKLKQHRVEGPADTLEHVEELYKHVRKELRGFLYGAALGWLWGALPSRAPIPWAGLLWNETDEEV